ncbi:hypothetical protein E3T28_14835 [Cryobacterium sinapicolor]|uniref:Uncharacterized protein n=1 Tax=Cryobacterium sinapicolor TaxID=1259236 RepID=A0ABY2IX45_9MICO|nr:hypothetical protein [Cryobacterium sinapicolor]TFC94575.1 hypothetical protein E3T28_14835 [Cryobacterium sinapicolor]
MAKGINIDIAANTRDFQAGVKDVDKSLSEVADSLDDLTRDTTNSADKAGKALGDGVEDGAKDAEQAVERVEKTFKALSDTARRESKDGGKALGDSYREGSGKAQEGLTDFKQEANSTARESAASFDGSADSIVGAFQEVAANAFAGFGPAGAVAGLAAAAGIGLIMKSLGDASTATEEVKTRTQDLAKEYIETGDLGVASMDYLIGRLQDLATEGDGINLTKLAKTAKESGSSFKDLAQAYAGNADGLKDLWREGDRRLKQMGEETDAAANSTNATDAGYAAKLRASEAQQKYMDYLGQAIGIADAAAASELLYAQSGAPEMEAKAALVDNIQGSIDDAAGSWTDYQDKETGAIDPAAFLAGVAERLAAANDYAANLAIAQAQLSPEAYQYLVDQGIDFAPMLGSILSSGLVGQFNTTFTDAANAGNAALDGTLVTDYTVNATADVKPVEDDLNGATNKSRTAKVDAKATPEKASADIDRAAAKDRTATINVKAALSDAESQISQFMNRSRSIRITANIVDRNGKLVN